jgi:hypothetical protein
MALLERTHTGVGKNPSMLAAVAKAMGQTLIELSVSVNPSATKRSKGEE